jgi:hypothetical protein
MKKWLASRGSLLWNEFAWLGIQTSVVLAEVWQLLWILTTQMQHR